MTIASSLSLLLPLLRSSAEVRVGVTAQGSGLRWVAVVVDGRNTPRIIAYGNDQSRLWRALAPVVVHTDLGMAPVRLVSERLDGADPDSWIAHNEERIIPAGFTSDQIVNEWTVFDDDLFSATVTKKAVGQAAASLEKHHLILASIGVPLWSLALSYAPVMGKSFVLWKLTPQGSILGLVVNGRLRSLVNFWADSSDVQSQPETVGRELAPILSSLCMGEEVKTVIVHLTDSGTELPKEFTIPGFDFRTAPRLCADLPAEFGEAYSIACHVDGSLDFTPVEQRAVSLRIASARRRALKTVRVGTIALCAMCLLLLGLDAGLRIARGRIDAQLRPVAAYTAQLTANTARLDSLRNVLGKRAEFLGRESSATSLLSDLQKVFPDGVWCESIALSEQDQTTWQLDISAVSFSTGMIPSTLKELQAVPGVADVRMLYSEQTSQAAGAQGKKAIRFRVGCSWKSGS